MMKVNHPSNGRFSAVSPTPQAQKHPSRVGNRSKRSCFTLVAFSGIAALCVPLLARAGDDTSSASGKDDTLLAAASDQKPAWLTQLSLEVREGYDSDTNATALDQLFSRTDPRIHGGFFTQINPSIGIDLAPTFANQDIFQQFSFGYSGSFISYPSSDDNSYDVHRFNNVIKAKVDDFTFTLENSYALSVGTMYNGVYNPFLPYAPGPATEAQDLLRGTTKLAIQYDVNDRWFLRPTASLLSYNELSTQTFPYVNRYDANGGMDAGYRLDPNVALTLGYRYGHQYQQNSSMVATNTIYGNASNDYQRVLVGIEGKPFKWLTLNAQGGPDFKHYDQGIHPMLIGGPYGIYPGVPSDPNVLTAYADIDATAQLTRSDTLTFGYKHYSFVCRYGSFPMVQSNVDVTYRHSFTKALSTELGIAYQTNNSMPYNPLNDHETDYHVGVRYAFSPNWSADVSYTYQDGLKAFPPTVSFPLNRSLVSIGTKWEF